mgnify:CR=1 FL=1
MWISAVQPPGLAAPSTMPVCIRAGLLGLYRGAHINMAKIAVASAVQLAVFDGVKARLQREQRWGREHPTAALLVAAMTAGLAVTAVIQPVDVITTRLWNQPGDGPGVLGGDGPWLRVCSHLPPRKLVCAHACLPHVCSGQRGWHAVQECL